MDNPVGAFTSISARSPAPRPAKLLPITFAILLGVLQAGSAKAIEIEGFTEPSRVISLCPQEPGTLIAVPVQEGDAVRTGDLVAELDSVVLQIQLQIARQAMEARGRLTTAEAELRHYTQRQQRLANLRDRGHATQDELDRAGHERETAEAGLLAAKEQLAVAALEHQRVAALLERRKLRSPIDGVVAQVHQQPGEFVLPSQPIVVTVVQLNPLVVSFAVPCWQTQVKERGQKVRVRFPDTARHIEGTVEHISPLVDAESGTVPVRVNLPNSAGELRSGMKCALEIGAEPAAAVQQSMSRLKAK